ncbi:MAG: hypothetical protein CVV57_02620 [Tenericutes bacterium HGW-Tenericutes-2]|nr:MAG: hypothetical protein CVV57_02620 [Tenericutes bacterium HGW-Tenericutes-2]
MFKNIIFKRLIILILISFSITFGVYAFLEEETGQLDSIPNFDEIIPLVDSNKYSHLKSDALATNQQGFFDEPIEILTVYGTVYLDPESLAFQVVNNNGYIWSSTINENVPGLPNTFKRRARSAIILESFNTGVTSFALTEENLYESNTEIELTLITNGFHALITFGRSGIQMGLYVTFGLDSIHVEIPYEEINESGVFKISSIKVYPYFGAVLENQIPGYVFLPDGIGALVDYKLTDPLISTNYQKEVYDRNIGYNLVSNMNTFLSGGTRIYAPVFGFVHGINQNAVFANITSGSEYAMINLYFPARTRGFTTVFSEFVYRKTYRQPIDKVGNTISLLQSFSNQMDIKIEYTLLENEDANYVGMAKTYRDYLDLESYESQYDSIPLRLDAIGIEKNKGLLFNQTTVMTTFSEFRDITLDLNSHGIDYIIGNFSGFTKRGVTWSAPQYENISRRLGSKNDLESLQEALSSLYFVTEYLKASNQSSGYNQYFDLAKKINDQLYTYLSGTDTKYLLEYHAVQSIMNKSIAKLSDEPIDGFAIESMGSLLYDDFSNKKYLPEAILMYQELLSNIEKDIALYDVNSYLWKSMDLYYDFPMYSSQYITFDDTVPFLSIVLSGSVQLFGPHANFYPYARDELLRLIDFGVYPSFVVTQKSSKELQETGLEAIYSSKYDDIKKSILAYYDFVDGALSSVIGQRIVDRQVITNGVIQITYENDIVIYVNYRETPFTQGSLIIGAKNYVIKDLNA